MVTVLYDGPAPVLNSLCEQLGVRRILDTALPWDETQCLLSPGQRINILLNRRPLYKMDETYSNMDTEKLFGPGISWRSLNDDALHADMTSVSVHGEYDIDDDETALKLTFGYSKDKRPDLRQFMYGLGVTKGFLAITCGGNDLPWVSILPLTGGRGVLK